MLFIGEKNSRSDNSAFLPYVTLVLMLGQSLQTVLLPFSVLYNFFLLLKGGHAVLVKRNCSKLVFSNAVIRFGGGESFSNH